MILVQPLERPSYASKPLFSLQNPFKYPREMTGLQGPLSGLPGVGVYVLGAALVVVLGGGASGALGSLAPGMLENYSNYFHHTHIVFRQLFYKCILGQLIRLLSQMIVSFSHCL
jgi:hypothetical protein